MTSFPYSALVDSVAAATGQKKTVVKKVIDAMIVEIRMAVSQETSPRLPGLGVFYMKHSAARAGRNPQTGRAIRIPAKAKLAFRASPSAEL